MLRVASVLALALMIGCAEDVGKDKAKATVSDVPEATDKTAAPATEGAATWKSAKEKAAEKNMRDGWTNSANWVNGWLADHPQT